MNRIHIVILAVIAATFIVAGAGPDQAPRQSGPNTGAADSNGAVRMVGDDYIYPDAGGVIRVTIRTTN